MSRVFSSFVVLRGLLYKVAVQNGEEIKQLELSSVYKQQVLTSLHDDGDYPPRDRSIDHCSCPGEVLLARL